MLVVAVVFNPIYPLYLPGEWSVGAHVTAAVVCLVAGVLIRFRRP